MPLSPVECVERMIVHRPDVFCLHGARISMSNSALMLAIKVHRDDRGEVYLHVLSAIINRRKQLQYTSDYTGWKTDAISNLAGAKKDLEVWHVPLRLHSQLTQCMSKSNGDCIVEVIPKYILQLLVPRVWPMVNVESKLPLMPFQRQGVEYIISRNGRGIIADGMGLGKTMQGLGILEYYSNLRPALIVCPAAVKENWKAHISKYLGETAHVLNNGKHAFCSDKINILSYNLSVSSKLDTTTFRPQLMILDESHYVKNVKSKRTVRAFQWSKLAKVVVLLTGTPMNKCIELYAQVKCVNACLFPKYFHYCRKKPFHCIATNVKPDPEVFFASRYCKPEVKYAHGREHIVFKGSENESELHAILREHVMIRRIKEDVLTDLPPKTREMIIIAEWKQSLPEKISSDTEFMTLVRETCVNKIQPVRRYIQDILLEELSNDPSLKVLIWAYYRVMIDAIHEFLTENGVSHFVMDGRTSQSDRDEYIRKFQEDGSNVQAAVLGLGSMNAGITLTASTLSIVCDLCFSPDIHLQSEDRNHRIGQTRPVMIRYLICQGSTDALIWNVLEKKTKTTGLVIDNSHATFEPETKRRRVDDIERTPIDVPFDTL